MKRARFIWFFKRNACSFSPPRGERLESGGRAISGVSAFCNRANDQHAQTPTPSAGAADPPHRGEGMQVII